MQLTAKFALLATALVYGSSSVLALPVGSSFAAREVEAREFQDELAYAREVPESMYLDARSFFDGDYEDMDARAIPADSAPVSAAAVTPATPASAVTPETPVTADPTDTKQKALSGPEGTPGSDAAAEHPPPSKHVLGEKESGVSGATRHHHTAAERKAYRAKLTPAEREKFDEHRKAALKAKLAKMTPAEREAYEKRRKTLRKAKLAKLTPAEREKYDAHRKAALKAKLAKMTPAEREAYETRHKERKEAKLAKLTPAEREAYEARRKERKEAKLGAKGATSESAATGLKKTATEDVPAKEPSTDGTSAKPASAASPAQPASAASLPK